MIKFYRFYLPILAVFSSLAIHAADDAKFKSDFERLKKNEVALKSLIKDSFQRSNVQLKLIIEYPNIEVRIKAASLDSLCRYTDEKAYIKVKVAELASSLTGTITDDCYATHCIIRIYHFLEDHKSRDFIFNNKWFPYWKEGYSNCHYPASIVIKALQANGLNIIDLESVRKCDPATVVNALDKQNGLR